MSRRAKTHPKPTNQMPAKKKTARQASATTPCSSEEWWARHAALLAAKMHLGGVGSFKIERQPNGKFSFEVTPEESPQWPGAAVAQSQGAYLGASRRQPSQKAVMLIQAKAMEERQNQKDATKPDAVIMYAYAANRLESVLLALGLSIPQQNVPVHPVGREGQPDTPPTL